MDEKGMVEAVIFFENKSVEYEEVGRITGIKVEKVKEIADELKKDYAERNTAIEVIIGDKSVSMQVKSEYVKLVSKIAENAELSKKAIKILGLIAKKKSIKQSELKNYFRGEIYSYVKELKDQEYVTSEKTGLTRTLKPTKKFYETFQMELGSEKEENK